jgi:nucleoside-diphosphate-sugar epimerase
MKSVIFGANGPTGRLATARALAAGHSVVAVTRQPREFPIQGRELTVVGADVLDAAAVGEAVAGADAVVSVLGVPFTREKVETYSVGTENIVAGMRAAGTTRLIVVSSTSVYPPRRQQAPLMLRLAEPIITRTIGKTVYDDMRRMEAIVSNSGLDWTVVRPSGLFDLPEPTKYVRGPIDPVGAFTARIDLAHYLISLVADSASVGRYVIVSTTEGTPTVLQMIRREAFSANASKPESARPASP